MPGTMMLSTSPRILSNGSPSSGARSGNCSRIAPGLSLGATHSCSMCSRKSAIQSASSCNCLRNSFGVVSSNRLNSLRDSWCRSCMVSAFINTPLHRGGKRRANSSKTDCLGCVASKRKTETEVERAEIFELVRVRIYTVVEANRTDRQFVTQTSTNRVAHVVQPDVLRRRQQIASVSKYGALQFAENRECIFNVEDGKKFSADRMTMIIMRAEITLGEAAHGRGAAIEKPFVDGNRSCLVGAALGERI